MIELVCISEASSIHSGHFWPEGDVRELILKRQEEIRAQREHWRPFIKENAQLDKALTEGVLISIEEGYGGAYFLQGSQGHLLFVIKPVDEDIFCLNNRKCYGSPFNHSKLRVRDEIPLYRSAQTDALASDIAEIIGLSHITPRASMALVYQEHFSEEKLCSVQEYIPQAHELFELLQTWIDAEWSAEQLEKAFDQTNFEQTNLFVWLLYDTDAHAGNFLAYEKNSEVYHLKKIDNNLSFPEKNAHLDNTLSLLPNANQTLSQELKTRIATLPMQKMIQKFHDYEMQPAIQAFEERVEVLKILANGPDISLKEIDLRLSLLKYSKELALSDKCYEELEALFEQHAWGSLSETKAVRRFPHRSFAQSRGKNYQLLQKMKDRKDRPPHRLLFRSGAKSQEKQQGQPK